MQTTAWRSKANSQGFRSRAPRGCGCRLWAFGGDFEFLARDLCAGRESGLEGYRPLEADLVLIYG